MQQNHYKAEITPFSVLFSDSENNNLFRISPSDDYIYSPTLEEHLINNSGFKETRNLIDEFESTLERLFLQERKLTWKITQGKLKITYEITTSKDDTVQIIRTLENLPAQTNAIGQTISLCKDCLVISENENLLYLKQDLLTNAEFEKAKKLNLIPLVTTEQLPVGITKLLILSPDGEKKLELQVSPDQEVYYLSDWNILVLKTPVSDQKTVKVSQSIKFF